MKISKLHEWKNWLKRLDWKYRVLLLIGGASLLAFLLGPRWVLSRSAEEISLEALERGAALTKSLALTNQAPLAMGQEVFYDVEMVLSERGVMDATLVDAEGRVVAPISRAGTRKSLPTKQDSLGIRKLEEGMYELSYPMETWQVTAEEAKKKRIGTAFLVFSTKRVLKLLETTRFQYWKFSAFVIIVMGGALYFLFQITEKPLEELSSSLQDCVRGERKEVEIKTPFAQLEEITDGINRLLKKRQEGPVADGERSSSFDSREIMTLFGRNFGEMTSEAILLADRENRLCFVNAASERIFGRRASELEGVHLLELAGPFSEAPALLELAHEALETPGSSKERTFAGGPVERIKAIGLGLNGKADYCLVSLKTGGLT